MSIQLVIMSLRGSSITLTEWMLYDISSKLYIKKVNEKILFMIQIRVLSPSFL